MVEPSHVLRAVLDDGVVRQVLALCGADLAERWRGLPVSPATRAALLGEAAFTEHGVRQRDVRRVGRRIGRRA